MSDKRTDVRLVGLDFLQFGPVTAGENFNTTVASFSTIGNTVPDSAHLVLGERTETELYIEEEDNPDIIILGAAKNSLEFATRDMGVNMLEYALGTNGSTTAGVYRQPTTGIVFHELSILARSKDINGKYLQIEIPKASVKSSGDLKFSRTDSGTLAFTCGIMVPASSTAISPLVIKQV